MIESLLIAMAPSLARILENAVSNKYDKNAELQAMLDMQDAIAKERLKHIVSGD